MRDLFFEDTVKGEEAKTTGVPANFNKSNTGHTNFTKYFSREMKQNDINAVMYLKYKQIVAKSKADSPKNDQKMYDKMLDAPPEIKEIFKTDIIENHDFEL